GINALATFPHHLDIAYAAWAMDTPVRLDVALGLVEASIAIDPNISNDTRLKWTQEIGRTIRAAVRRDADTTDALTPELIEEIIWRPGRNRRGDYVDPEVSTVRNRRSAIRMFFNHLRALGVDVGDPTIDLALPQRSDAGPRPLTDEEMRRCQDASFDGLLPGTRPTCVALAQ